MFTAVKKVISKSRLISFAPALSVQRDTFFAATASSVELAIFVLAFQFWHILFPFFILYIFIYNMLVFGIH